MTLWLESGEVKYKEQIINGQEHAPAALNDLLVGNSFGKMVVKVA
jgi:alcohol dehydrogenase